MFGFSLNFEAYINKILLLSVISLKDELLIFKKICGFKNSVNMLTKGVIIEKHKLCVASVSFLA